MLTNFNTISKRLTRLKELEEIDFDDVAGSGRTKKELLILQREKIKLEKTLGGIRSMQRVPSAVWIVDTKKEHLAVDEARKLGLPVIAILDTNCDPDEVDYKIPGNDDAIRSVTLLTRVIADAVAEGIVARAGGSRAAGEEQVAAEEPLAEWERELYAEAAAAEATEVAPEVTPSAEVTADIPTEADVVDQAQPLPTTGSEPEADDTAKHSGAEILVAEAEKAEQADAKTGGRREDRGSGSGLTRLPLVGRKQHRRPTGGAGLPPDPSPDHGTRRAREMANFTAADIKTLREQTGAGMLDVKKALDEADGDHAKAAEILRVKGRRASRSARAAPPRTAWSRPRPRTASAPSSRSSARPTSSPRARSSSPWRSRSSTRPSRRKVSDADALLKSTLADGRTVQELVDESNAVIGEKIEVKRVARVEGERVAAYLHKTSPDLPAQIGVLVAIAGGDDQVARDIAMHAAALPPTALTRDDIPAETVENERRLAEATAREEGKPEAAMSRIVEGRVNGFFKDNVLIEQAFAKDQKKTVGQVLKDAKAEAQAFARFRVGS